MLFCVLVFPLARHEGEVVVAHRIAHRIWLLSKKYVDRHAPAMAQVSTLRGTPEYVTVHITPGFRFPLNNIQGPKCLKRLNGVIQRTIPYADTAAAFPMSLCSSGRQEPQLVPAFNRRPMDERSWQPAAIAASIALQPTPKHAHTVTPVSRRGSAGRVVSTRARSLDARRGLSNSDSSHDRERTRGCGLTNRHASRRSSRR